MVLRVNVVAQVIAILHSFDYARDSWKLMGALNMA